MVYTFFSRKSSDSGVKSLIILYQQSSKEWHKPIVRQFEKRKAYSSFKDNIWCRCVDLADIQVISKFKKQFLFLLCVIHTYSKDAWVVPLKNKKRYYNY